MKKHIYKKTKFALIVSSSMTLVPIIVSCSSEDEISILKDKTNKFYKIFKKEFYNNSGSHILFTFSDEKQYQLINSLSEYTEFKKNVYENFEKTFYFTEFNKKTMYYSMDSNNEKRNSKEYTEKEAKDLEKAETIDKVFAVFDNLTSSAFFDSNSLLIKKYNLHIDNLFEHWSGIYTPQLWFYVQNDKNNNIIIWTKIQHKPVSPLGITLLIVRNDSSDYTKYPLEAFSSIYAIPKANNSTTIEFKNVSDDDNLDEFLNNYKPSKN